MEIKDILGLGKMLPMDKLLEMISKSFGTATKPFFDRRDVDTKAYEIRKLAEAKVDAMKIMASGIRESSAGTASINYSEGGMTIESFKQTRDEFIRSLPAPPLVDRTNDRVSYQEAVRQINVESVTAAAAGELENEPPVTNQPVDDGWASRFFRYAEDVSDEGMQAIWGRILAGEIKQPNTYSIRTLEVLRNLSKNEADLFVKVADFAMESNNNLLLFKGNSNELDNFGINFMHLAMLREAGILHESDLTNYNIQKSDEPGRSTFTVGNLIFSIERQPSQSDKSIPVYVFTQVGQQLLKLIKVTPNWEYLKTFAKFVKDEETTAKYAYFTNRSGDSVQLIQPFVDFPAE